MTNNIKILFNDDKNCYNAYEKMSFEVEIPSEESKCKFCIIF